MYQRIISVLCVLAIALASVLSAHAEPIINEVVQAEVTGQATPPATTVAPTNPVFLPLINYSHCFALSPLAPVAASATCGILSDFVGSQGPSSFVATVHGEHAALFDTDMPHVAVSIPITGVHIGPQSAGIVFSRVVRLSAMSFMTDTADIGDVDAANVKAGAPFMGRLSWVLSKAMQEKDIAEPILFPVSITTLHYSQPSIASQITTIFEKCADILNAGQLALPGFPYDLVAADATTRAGNIWLRMYYPACPAISGYYVKLSTFYQNLKVFPQYQNIDAEAQAMIGPSTYHVSNLAMKMPDGQVLLIGATIVVVAIGALVVIAIFPEVGVGWWLLSGAAALQQQEEVDESRKTVLCVRC